MPPKSNKIYKLKPTDGPLSRDDLSTWIFTVQSHARQYGWADFLSDGVHSTWTATAEDPNNGLQILSPDQTTVDQVATNKLRSNFRDFLAAVAANCPTGFTDTVIRESTSFKWIEETIKKTFNLSTTGESFLDGINIKFDFDNSFTYQQAWMMIKDHYISSLLPSGSKCMGKTLTADETLTPLATNFLVEKWLTKIDPRLPDYVRTSRGYLFTEARPTLACNQQILSDQIDQMLHELDTKETMNSNINISYVQQSRGGRGGYSRTRPNRLRGRGRGNPSPRYQDQSHRSSYNCHLCLEARRYDSSITHSASNCPFPQRRNATRQPQSMPPFKVLLVPTNQPTPPTPNQLTSNSLSNCATYQHLTYPQFTPDHVEQDQYYEDVDYEDQLEHPVDRHLDHYDSFEGNHEEL